MRKSILASLMLLGLSSMAVSQDCETMIVKNAYGQMISNSLMCRGSDGVWIETPQSVPIEGLEPAQIEGPTPLPKATLGTPAPSPIPVTNAIATLIASPEPVARPATIIVEPPLAATAPAVMSPAPTSRASGRHAVYAKLGLVCIAEQAMNCSSVTCGGLCAGMTGWCDGETGETYTSLEAIERAHCRKK